MGKRSRKRASAGADVSPAGTSREERDAARRRRAEAVSRAKESGTSTRRARRGRPTIDERPEAPWGSFPLVEIAVFLAIVMFVAGLVIGGTDGRILLIGALALGSLAGLELAIREHFAGYRSHSTLLAAVAGLGAAAPLCWTPLRQ